MIRIIKDISNKPSSLSSPACLSSLNSVIQGNTSEIKSDYYRGIELITSDGITNGLICYQLVMPVMN